MLRHRHTEARLRSQRGFTLIELTLALTITGVIMAGLFGAMKQNGEIKSARMNNTFDTLLLGMAEFHRMYGYYPCPANPTLVQGDANYGEPNLDGSGACVPALPGLSAPGASGGTVITGAVPVRALNIALGCVHLEEAELASMPDNLRQVFQNKLNTARQIFFGDESDYDDYAKWNEDHGGQNITETSRRCLPDTMMADIYQNKISYTVNLAATALTAMPPSGNISIVNRFNQRVTEQMVNFVMLSHGKDAKGAYPANGSVINTPCGGGGALDDENCNAGAVFRSMPLSPMGNPYAANHYDDRIEFSLTGYSRERDVWRWAEGADANTRNLVFEGKDGQPLVIGVPQESPEAKEKVGVYGGNMQVDGNVTAQGAPGIADIQAAQTVKATENIVSDNEASAPQFCYDPPLTASCGP